MRSIRIFVRLAAVVSAGIAAPVVAATTAERYCLITDVTAFEARVHIRCSQPPMPSSNNGPGGALETKIDKFLYEQTPYFAVESSSPLAGQLAVLGVAAMQSNMVVKIVFRTDTALNPVGCQKNDCRRLLSFWMIK